MRSNYTLTLLIAFAFISATYSQQLESSSSDVCIENQCSNLVSTQVLKYIEQIQEKQQECISQCKGLDFKCIEQCTFSLLNDPQYQRVKKCFEAKCLANTLLDNVVSLKKFLGASAGGDCTAQLRNYCNGYIEVYNCPRRCLQNWVPTDCIACTYDYC